MCILRGAGDADMCEHRLDRDPYERPKCMEIRRENVHSERRWRAGYVRTSLRSGSLREA